MAGKAWDIEGEARRALEGIVQDPQYGAAALSKPTVMSNLLKDLLPDQPREAGLLAAAAHADLAGILRRYVDQGLDTGTATTLTVRSFTDSTSHTPEACSWVVGEIALALGLEQPVAAHEPGEVAAPASVTRQSPLPTARLDQVIPETRDLTPAPPEATGQQTHQDQQVQQARENQPAWATQSPPIPVGAAVAGCAAVYFLLLACVAPFARYSGSRPESILNGYPGHPGSETFWFAVEPVGVLLIALGATVLLFAPQRLPRLGRLLPAMLMAFGVQTILLFAGYAFATAFAQHEVGGFVGIVGGAALLAAGLASQRRDGPRTADETAARAASARRLIIALTAAGAIAVIASILWLAGVAPGFLNAGSATEVGGRHAYRGIAAAAGGVAAFAAAWALSRRRARRAAGPAAA